MPSRLPAVTLVLLAAACGSSGGGPSSNPAPSPSPLGPPIMTITASGVDPQVLHTFDAREAVTFVNADARAHDLRSDPHPAHTDCPAINVSAQDPGQSRTTNALTTVRTCGFHDHLNDTVASLRGTITVR